MNCNVNLPAKIVVPQLWEQPTTLWLNLEQDPWEEIMPETIHLVTTYGSPEISQALHYAGDKTLLLTYLMWYQTAF